MKTEILEKVIKVYIDDLEEKIGKVYGKEEINLADLMQWNDYTYQLIDLTNEESFSATSDEDLKEFIDKPIEDLSYFPLHEIMYDLVKKGEIEKGLYLIDITW